MAGRLLPAMEPAFSPVLARSANALGIAVRCRVQGHRRAVTTVAIEVENEAGERSHIECDKVVVAVGRDAQLGQPRSGQDRCDS